MGKQMVEQGRAQSHLRVVRVYSKVILGLSPSSVLWTSVYSFTPPHNPGRSEKTYAYKTADKLEIQADVYPGKGDGPRPTLIWIHGGALIMGDKSGIDDT